MRLSCERDVDALYMLLLGRLPESAQIYHENLGQSALEAAGAIIESIEFAEILEDFRQHDTLPHGQLGADAFRDAIGAAVELGLAPPDLLDLHDGTYDAEILTQRDAAEFIASAYRIILRREADPEGREYYRARLERGTQSKRQIIEDLLRSEEAATIEGAPRVVWGGAAIADGSDIGNEKEESDWFAALARIFASAPLNPLIERHHGAAVRELVAHLCMRCRSQPIPAEIEPDAGLAIFLDSPELQDGTVALPAQRSIWINGWVRARDGVAAIEVFVDGAPLGPAARGLARPDVAAEFSDWPEAAQSGFIAFIPRHKLPKGGHVVEIILKDTSGRTQAIAFTVNVAEGLSDPLSLRRKIAQSEIDLYHHILSKRDWYPRFCLLLLIGNEDGEIARAQATLSSLREQAYRDWHVLVALRRRSAESDALREQLMDGSETVGTLLARLHDGHADPGGLRGSLLVGFEDIAERVEVLRGGDGRSLAELAGSGTGPALFGLLAAGDELSVDALLELAVTSALYRDADFLYSDELRISPVSGETEPFLKPQWSPDLLLSTNYIGRLWCVAPLLLARAGATLRDLLRLGEYDLVLRLTETAEQSRHVPEILCQRGRRRLDSAATEKGALARAMARCGIAGEVQDGCVPGTYRLKRELIKPGLVSIIICTCAARGLIKTCLESLRALTAYRAFEVIIVENVPPSQAHWKEWLRANADRVIAPDEPFNGSRFNNLGAAAARGEYLLFLNDGIEVIEPDWLDALVEHGQRPEIGAVGPMLLQPDRTVQSAGVFLIPDVGRGRPAFRNLPEHDPGYFGLAMTQRNAIGVLGACLLTRKEVFARLGRFDEGHNIVNNELDYCLKAWRAGLLNVFTPYAKLIHHERTSRKDLADDYDAVGFAERWHGVYAEGDPYHHPRLSKQSDHFVPEPEPLRLICAGRPLLRREAVRNILVVKLDHIGDCITAFAAIRRLKERFPTANLRVLAGRWTKPVWSLVEGIDEVIEFDFFHNRADQGMREVTEAELQFLQQRLAPYRFDLAVDMRKHPDTRHILQYSGARFLAGFDTRGLFPWLDISLEWDEDRACQRKRHHASDELVNLVDAISASCEPERRFAAELPCSPLPMSEASQHQLFSRRVVCIHPAAGDKSRQWPPARFAALIDLLVEREDVNIALIGSRDDQEIASKVLQEVRNRRAVANLLGRLPLESLPDLLRRCALFVGNNSGPHHLAATLGVPTIGIHSGLVDAREWGPLGPYALALQRDMECSPCYLPSHAHCPRALACLTGLHPGDVYRACRKLLALGFGDRPFLYTAEQA
jgi:ADP-heptose:LPS heptosyltransferase/GT2 family glycosyltransferase